MGADLKSWPGCGKIGEVLVTRGIALIREPP